MMSDNPIEITHVSGDLDFYFGDKRIITYNIKNTGVYTIDRLKIEAVTIKKHDSLPTSSNYVETISEFSDIMAKGESQNFDITIKIPENFNETYICEEGGKPVHAPIKLKINANYTQIIK